MFPDYPFHADILTSLQNASVRPQTPAYQSVSIVISHHVSPPASINPVGTQNAMASEINDALSVEVGDPVSAATSRVPRPASASGTHRRVKSR